MDVSVSFNKIPPHCCVTQFSSENEREALFYMMMVLYNSKWISMLWVHFSHELFSHEDVSLEAGILKAGPSQTGLTL